MIFKRFLFLLTNEDEIDEIIKFSKALGEKYQNIEKDVVYVKDLVKYDVFPLTIQGLGVNANTHLILEEYLEIENRKFEEYKEKLLPHFRKVYYVEGEIIEATLEELKAYDLIVICKNKQEQISDNLSSLLKKNYKPLIILSNTEKEYNFDKILMLNDGGYRVNSSVYQYFNTFGVKDIDVLRVNIEDKNRLTERFGTTCNIMDKTGDETEIILSMAPNYDMLIMGELKFSLLFEKLTGRVGVKVIENTKTPIFMG